MRLCSYQEKRAMVRRKNTAILMNRLTNEDMKTKINWNQDSRKNARLTVSDGVTTCYVSDDQLPEEFTLREVAEAYARSYDHNGNDDTLTVAENEDLTDCDKWRFAFDGHGNFEWDTDRDFIHY
jgi:hypothetical protein